MIEPILDSDRDRRAWAWICQQAGEDRARAVELAGRRPYPSNIAKALGLVIPKDLEIVSGEAARLKAGEALAVLKGRS